MNSVTYLRTVTVCPACQAGELRLPVSALIHSRVRAVCSSCPKTYVSSIPDGTDYARVLRDAAVGLLLSLALLLLLFNYYMSLIALVSLAFVSPLLHLRLNRRCLEKAANKKRVHQPRSFSGK